MDAQDQAADSPPGARRSTGHPSFGKPGNSLARTHGAWSPALREPIAEAIHAARMTDPATPAFLRDDPSYLPELRELAKVEAIAELMWSWILDRGLAEALTDATTETEVARQEGHTRKTVRRSRRVVAVIDQYRRYSAQASRMRHQLGLTPLGRRALGPAVAPKKDVMVLMKERIEELDREDDGGS